MKKRTNAVLQTLLENEIEDTSFDEILLLDDETDKDPNPTKNETFYSELVTLHCTQSVSLIVTYYTVQGIGFELSTWAVLSLNCGHFLRDNASLDACKKY